jgi:hypothetical protein
MTSATSHDIVCERKRGGNSGASRPRIERPRLLARQMLSEEGDRENVEAGMSRAMSWMLMLLFFSIFFSFYFFLMSNVGETRRGVICWFCKSREIMGQSFSRCGACKNEYYCGRTCQVSDWPTHRVASYSNP